MKFGTRTLNGREQAIVRGKDGAIRALADVTEAAGLGRIEDVLSLVRACETQPGLLRQLEPDALPGQLEAGTDWAPPLPNPSMILNVAFNNRELMRNAHVDPGVPNFFLKPPSCMIGSGKAIIVDPDWGAVIPEPEVCAVIGKRAKHVRGEVNRGQVADRHVIDVLRQANQGAEV